MTADLCELNARGGVLDVTIIHNFLLQIVSDAATSCVTRRQLVTIKGTT